MWTLNPLKIYLYVYSIRMSSHLCSSMLNSINVILFCDPVVLDIIDNIEYRRRRPNFRISLSFLYVENYSGTEDRNAFDEVKLK